MLQAHATFSRLRWVAGGVIFACSLLLASRLSAGMHWKRLVLPVLGILLSLGTALKAEKYKQLMEFNDYRLEVHTFFHTGTPSHSMMSNIMDQGLNVYSAAILDVTSLWQYFVIRSRI